MARRWNLRGFLVLCTLVGCEMEDMLDDEHVVQTDLMVLTDERTSIVIRDELVAGDSTALDTCLSAFGIRTLLRFETANDVAEVQLVDAQGQLVAMAHEHCPYLDITDVAPGTYQLRAER